MASSRSTAAFIAGQAGAAARPMFGEFGLYHAGILVALLCDDRLFLKPSAAGRADPDLGEEAPPYPGAKPHLVVPAEVWEDADRLAGLFRDTAAALPPPQAKTGKAKAGKAKAGEAKPRKPADLKDGA